MTGPFVVTGLGRRERAVPALFSPTSLKNKDCHS